MKQDRLAVASVVRCILKPHHALLRNQALRAAGLIGEVVVQQRPPLCRTLLPLYRLFQEFRGALEEHLDAQDKQLFPLLFELEAALQAGDRRLPSADELSEALRLLKYAQLMLTSVMDEMCALTEGFSAPAGVCKSYVELLRCLQEIQMELASEVRMETNLMLPAAAELLDHARHCHAGAAEQTGRLFEIQMG